MTAESCIKCGSCKALCPTHMEIPSEGMGGRGRTVLLSKLLNGEIKASARLNELVHNCILCGACNTLCPLGIDITDTIYRGREALRDFGKKKRLLGAAVKFTFKNPSVGFTILKILERAGEILPVYKFQPFKTLKKLDIRFPDYTLRDGISIFKVLKPKGRIAIFTGCTTNYLYPSIGKSLIKSLNAMNYDVILPKGEICCGAPLMGLGLTEDAAELADRNIKIFKKLNVGAVISPCPTCVDFIKNGYKKMVDDSIETAVELTDFFSKAQLPSANMEKKGTIGKPPRVLYHAPCHSIYNLKIGQGPKNILKTLGTDLIEPADRGCCGFGGTFRLSYPGLSDSILDRRMSEYSKADMIVTSCPNCIIQLRSRIKNRPVKHIIEIIEEALT